MSNFAIYMIGIVIVAGALAYGAYALSVPPVWIGVGAAVILAGLSVARLAQSN